MKLVEAGKTTFKRLKPGQYFRGPHSSLFYRADSNAVSLIDMWWVKVAPVDLFGQETSLGGSLKRSGNCPVFIYELRKETQQKEEEIEMEKLFKIKGTEDFGNVIATDSKGQKIFELRTGGIKIVDPSDVEEVFPYTFDVVFSTNDKKYGFLGSEGKVKIGDLLIYKNDSAFSLCRVVSIDTKNRSATKEFSGWKLQSEVF